MNICQCCGEATKNAKYCSKSCAAKINNKLTPKRSVSGKCKKCGKGITASRSYCKPCFKTAFLVDPTTTTYGELVGKRNYQKHSRIRDLARKFYAKSDKPKQCINCGYDKHYEVCHIKALKDHKDIDLLSDINDLTNLIALCPNCHWEFDKGLLSIDTLVHPAGFEPAYSL